VVGAPHHRKRIWILAYSNHVGLQRFYERQKSPNETNGKSSNPFISCIAAQGVYGLSDIKNIRRGARVAHRVDRLKAIGNGQVPAVAALAFIILSEGLI